MHAGSGSRTYGIELGSRRARQSGRARARRCTVVSGRRCRCRRVAGHGSFLNPVHERLDLWSDMKRLRWVASTSAGSMRWSGRLRGVAAAPPKTGAERASCRWAIYLVREGRCTTHGQHHTAVGARWTLDGSLGERNVDVSAPTSVVHRPRSFIAPPGGSPRRNRHRRVRRTCSREIVVLGIEAELDICVASIAVFVR